MHPLLNQTLVRRGNAWLGASVAGALAPAIALQQNAE